MKKTLIILLISVYLPLMGQPLNYDETKVPEYELPDPLLTEKGRKVRTKGQWERNRRPEILSLFETEMFGKMPPRPEGLRFEVISEDPSALDGRAVRKEVAIYLDEASDYNMTMLMYIPVEREGAVPVFLGLNFKGNHGTTSDPEVSLPTKEKMEAYGPEYKFYERGDNARRWPYEYLISNGYAVVTMCREDVDPDWHDGFMNGVHGVMDAGKERKADSWGSVAAWSWGLSRAMDYIETDEALDEKRVAVIGHSRLGKAALWAGATDTRFALVISNDSGCSGAAISRRQYGETLRIINKRFPHWFCDNYHKYSTKENTLPFDQHQLIALMAPRPVYVASASEDRWADPKGEMLSLVHASPVYELYGYEPFVAEELPALGTGMSTDRMGYHLREGKHDLLIFDWEQYVQFADKYLK